MAKKVFGDSISLNWDSNSGPLPRVGEFLISARWAYLVGLVRVRNTRDGAFRAHVRAMRIDPDTIPARAKQREMGFIPRNPVKKA
jgi:hypothetical protein